MKDKILQIIKKEDSNLNHISALLKKYDPNITLEDIKICLNSLVKDKIIFKNVKNKYSIIRTHYIVDTLKSKSKGEKYIMCGDEKIIIPPSNLHTALKDDLVVVDITSNKIGSILGILNRKNNKLVCEVKEYKNKLILVPFNGNCELCLSTKKEFFKDLIVGDRVYVTLDNVVDEDNCVIVNNVTKIGHFNDKMNDEIAIAISKNFDIDFSEETIEEVKCIPTSVRECDKVNRVDLTNENIFTIDSISTKDMDDAVSIKKLYNGNFELSVHIADVSHYVRVGSNLFKDALKRGTSVYLGDVVIPMIPSELSNGICSLNEGVERLTKTVCMEINRQGKVINYKIFDSVIKSKKKMSYEDLNKIFSGEEIEDTDYLKFSNDLELMRELSNILYKRKNKKGNLEFDSSDMKVHKDANDSPIEFEKRENGEAEKIIEHFMILCNETVAEHFYWLNLTFIYRVHNNPDIIKIDKTMALIDSLGYKIKQINNAYGQKAIQKLLESFKGKPEFVIISNLILRNMAKASYSTNNIGHFALATDNYCHFTSPIRRFPDLAIHALTNKYINNSTNSKLNHFVKELNDVAMHSSYKERQADDAEKDYIKLKMAQYMEKHKDEEFEGFILDIDKDSVYIMLDNNVKGILDINGDFLNSFDIDNNRRLLQCGYSHEQVKIGTRVKLRVTLVDIPQKQVYFDITKVIKNKVKKLNK